MITPRYSLPFIFDTGATISSFHLSAYASESNVSFSDLSAVTLETLSINGPSGSAWYRLANLPNVVTLGYHSLALVIARTNDTLIERQVLEAGSPADFDLMGLAGIYPVTLTVLDSRDSHVGVDVSVAVWNAALTTQVLPGATTDTSGQLIVALPLASYNLLVFQTGAVFENPFPLVVSGVPATLTIQGLLPALSPPTPPKVTVIGFLANADGSPIIGADVVMTLLVRPQLLTTLGVASSTLTVTSNIQGYFEFVVFGGLSVSLRIDRIGFFKSGMLPESGTTSLEEINTLFT